MRAARRCSVWIIDILARAPWSRPGSLITAQQTAQDAQQPRGCKQRSCPDRNSRRAAWQSPSIATLPRRRVLRPRRRPGHLSQRERIRVRLAPRIMRPDSGDGRGPPQSRVWSSRLSHRQRLRHERWPTGRSPGTTTRRACHQAGSIRGHPRGRRVAFRPRGEARPTGARHQHPSHDSGHRLSLAKSQFRATPTPTWWPIPNPSGRAAMHCFGRNR